MLSFCRWIPFGVLGGRGVPAVSYNLLTIQFRKNASQRTETENASAVAANFLDYGYMSGLHRLCATRLLLLLPFPSGTFAPPVRKWLPVAHWSASARNIYTAAVRLSQP